MLNQIKKRLQNRQNAGRLLAEKLVSYKHGNTIVLAIPRGGIPVAHEIAASLNLPFEITFARRIKHPAHSELSIGAVTLDKVVLHETPEFIPQNYIAHQVNTLQQTLREEFNTYYRDQVRRNLNGATVLLVDDVLRDMDELSACLYSIRKQQPEKIVVAAAVMSIRAVNFLMEDKIECHYLFTEFHQQSKTYTYFPEVTQEEIATGGEAVKAVVA